MLESNLKARSDIEVVPLSALRPGERGIVERVESGDFNKGLAVRLKALGVRTSRLVAMLQHGWFGGPLIVRSGSATEIAIRRTEAALVMVRRI